MDQYQLNQVTYWQLHTPASDVKLTVTL